MCIDREPTWGTEVHHSGLCQFLETCFAKRAAKGEVLMRQDDLLVLHWSSIDFLGTRFTTCDYINGTKGYYMPKENFLYFRKSERMVAENHPSHTHLPTGPHHNPNTHPRVTLVPGPHQPSHPRY